MASKTSNAIMRFSVPLLWTLASISFFIGSGFCVVAEDKVPEGLEEAMWGAGFCLSSVGIAILAIIAMWINYLHWVPETVLINNKTNSNKKPDIPAPVIFLEEE